MTQEATVVQLEACIPNALNLALGDAFRFGMDVPQKFSKLPLEERQAHLIGALATTDSDTLDRFLDKTARKAPDRVVPPTQLLLEEEAAIDRTLVLQSPLPQPVVDAVGDGLSALTAKPIDGAWGLPMHTDPEGRLLQTGRQAPSIASVLEKVRAVGYSVKTLIEGPTDWQKGSIPLDVTYWPYRRPRRPKTTQLLWSRSDSSLRVLPPNMDGYTIDGCAICDPEAARRLRRQLGYQASGLILK